MREMKENGILKKKTTGKAKSAPIRTQSGVETRTIGTFLPDSRNAWTWMANDERAKALAMANNPAGQVSL
jgi:hypothetical protein